ncbi:MAG: MogA/MoaB family molybdenum cofactor biosynthesis protein [Methanoregula sp.]|jgi:molybdenum cofactor biosynthesis protein B
MKPEHIQQVTITAAVITVSTTRTKETDTSGRTLREILEKAGIRICHYEVVKDQIDAIRAELIRALDSCNCIILNGGTGLTHDDCTIEAVLPLLEKKIDGFGELFRLKSLDEIGTSAMLSRAIAGTIGGKVVFCIPGSTPAVILAAQQLIVPEIVHIISHASQ